MTRFSIRVTAFLRVRIQRSRKRGSDQRYVYTSPHWEAIAALKRKVRALTARASHRTLKVLGACAPATLVRARGNFALLRASTSDLDDVADGAPGIWRAVSELWPAAASQRCTVHALRNVSPEAERPVWTAKRATVFETAALGSKRPP